jgi:ankyrin repeat protein
LERKAIKRNRHSRQKNWFYFMRHKTVGMGIAIALALLLGQASSGFLRPCMGAVETDPSMTALMLAAKTGDYHALVRELGKNPDLEVTNSDGDTPLLLAVGEGHMLLVTTLIEAGANVNAQSGRYGYSPLMLAASQGIVPLMQKLVHGGAQINARSTMGQSALYLAAFKGHFEAAEFLINAGADINAKDEVGQTPLYLAAAYGHDNLVSLLLAKGADPNIHSGPEKKTPLIIASAANQAQTVKRLLEYRTSVHLADKDGMTALMWAASQGFYDICRMLLMAGASFDITDNDGRSALAWAAQNGYGEIVALMLGSSSR